MAVGLPDPDGGQCEPHPQVGTPGVPSAMLAAALLGTPTCSCPRPHLQWLQHPSRTLGTVALKCMQYTHNKKPETEFALGKYILRIIKKYIPV